MRILAFIGVGSRCVEFAANFGGGATEKDQIFGKNHI